MCYSDIQYTYYTFIIYIYIYISHNIHHTSWQTWRKKVQHFNLGTIEIFGQKSGPETRYRCRHSVSNSAPCPRIPHILRGILMMGMFGGDVVFFWIFWGFLDGGGEWKRWENKRQDFPPLKWGMCRMSRSLMINGPNSCPTELYFLQLWAQKTLSQWELTLPIQKFSH